MDLLKLKSSNYFSLTSNYHTKISNEDNNDAHSHEFIEIFYVLSGSATHILNQKSETLKIGDLFILRKSDVHFFKKLNNESFIHRDFLIKEEHFQALCLSISPIFYQEISQQCPIRLHLTPSQIDKLENWFSQARLFSFTAKEKTEISLNFALLHILELYYNTYTENTLSQNHTNNLIRDILDLLDRPTSFCMNASNVLSASHYDHAYICKLFKATTGMTISQYINKNRLEYANVLLKTSDLSLNEIAFTVGYNNYSYFYRAFLNYFKMTPQKAKSQHRK